MRATGTLKARVDAEIGIELAFGGPRLRSPWSQCVPPEARSETWQREAAMPLPERVGKDSHVAPTPERQALDIQALVADATAEPEQGDVWAVVERRWWLRWQRYTGCASAELDARASDADPKAQAKSEIHRREIDADSAGHPGPIDNSGLVMEAGAPGTVMGSGRRLLLHLVRGHHLVLVPQEAWFALRAWYGGGPSLPRRLVAVEDSVTGQTVFEPQLYPEFSRLDHVLQALIADPVSAVSAKATEDVLRRRLSCQTASPSSGASEALASVIPGIPQNGRLHNGGPDGGKCRAHAQTNGHLPLTSDAETKTGKPRPVPARDPCASCGREAKAVCGGCVQSRSVKYCSRGCQIAHRQYHENFCGRDGRAALALARRGKAGMTNLGNTCFLSSAVQCLSHVLPLTQHILSNAFVEDVNSTNPLGTGGRLVQEYERLLKKLWFGSESAVAPVGLKKAIAKFAPQFNGFAQHDCQEVLSFLLDGLHEDLNRILEKPYLTLPDGECGRPDAIIAAECWELFEKRDRSVLIDHLYGQFKSTLECPQCHKVSRKFDEFNVVPVDILAGSRLCVTFDFAPLLAPSPPGSGGKQGEGKRAPIAAEMLGGKGKEGRKPRRVGVVLARDARISDLKVELAKLFPVAVEALLVVALPNTGPIAYTAVPDSAQVWAYSEHFEITVHEVIPGMRHALVVNRLFEGGRHLVHEPDSPARGSKESNDDVVRERWMEEVRRLAFLRPQDKDGAFVVSFPADISCLGLMEIVGSYTGDFLLPSEEMEASGLGMRLARYGSIKLSDARDLGTRLLEEVSEADRAHGMVVTPLGRYIPPSDDVRAADVLDTHGGSDSPLDFLRLEWSGRLLEEMDASRVHEPFGLQNHESVQEAERRVKRVSLEDCLEKFSVPETLGEDNSWYCSKCKELRQAVKTIQLWTLPEVLILHLKRFANTGPARRKVELFVEFPIEGLNMSPYCRGETLEGGRPIPALYDLFSVSNHMGVMGHGHYTAYVRDWETAGMTKQWYVCDDQDCRPVTEEQVCSPDAYVLFYRRRPLS